MLQARMLRVRVPIRWIFLNLSNPSSRNVALGSTQTLTEMNTRNLPGGEGGAKCGRLVRLTALLPSVSRLSRENMGASTSHNPMGLHVLLQGYFYLLWEKRKKFGTVIM
jgi:hypothetical protein